MANAHDIIERCGGCKTVADWLGINSSTVQRWTYDAERGCGNKIPAKNWASLIAAAKLHGIDISPEELIPPAAKAAAQLPTRKRARSAA